MKVDEDAVRDSLACLTAIAEHSSKRRLAIFKNGGLAALRTALSSTPPVQIWAVRLLASLFADDSERERLLAGLLRGGSKEGLGIRSVISLRLCLPHIRDAQKRRRNLYVINYGQKGMSPLISLLCLNGLEVKFGLLPKML